MPLRSLALRLRNTFTSKISSYLHAAPKANRPTVWKPDFFTPSIPQYAINHVRSQARHQGEPIFSTEDGSSRLEECPSHHILDVRYREAATNPIIHVVKTSEKPASSPLSAQNSGDQNKVKSKITIKQVWQEEKQEQMTSAPPLQCIAERKRRVQIRYSSGRRLQRRNAPSWLLSQCLSEGRRQDGKISLALKLRIAPLNDRASTPLYILLRHVYHNLGKFSRSRRTVSEEPGSNSQTTLDDKTAAILARQGFTNNDIESWAWALMGGDPNVMAERYLCLRHPKPSYLLRLILRKPLTRVQTLRALLLDVWNQIEHFPSISKFDSEEDISRLEPRNSDQQDYHVAEQADFKFFFTEASFIALLTRLLDQARRLWPPAIVSVAQMFKAYHLSQSTSSGPCSIPLNRQKHALLCKQSNRMICLLSTPAVKNPMKSMIYSWMAQRIILDMGRQYEPRLILNAYSYSAIIRVLAALQKSERESESALNRRREWPPWTVERSGMDARKAIEEDFSRVVLAGMSMRAAGFVENTGDVALKVIGGLEADGTPTIHTRTLSKLQTSRSEADGEGRLNPKIWAARVEATRDIQEAWSAFTAFESEGGQAHLSLYHAMFQKLNSEAARQGRHRVQEDVTPGDATGIMAPLTDNITAYYQSRLQPPSLDALYARMIEEGIRPRGQCLVFLVRHARTLSQGLQFLRDAGKDESVIAYLGGFSRTVRSDALAAIPDPLYTAFIELLCRSAPQAELVTSDIETDKEVLAATGNDTPLATSDRQVSGLNPPTRWEIRQLRLPYGLENFDPMTHAVALLRERQCRRQAWYTVFSALARRGFVINRDKAGEPENDILSWRTLENLWQDFIVSGGELDGRGFRIICFGFEKAILAVQNGASYDKSHILAAFVQIKDEFRRLSETSTKDARHQLPVLIHELHGADLHMYVRVAGLVEDFGELLFVLRWMIWNHESLYERALQARNGRKLLRRAIVAIRIFVTGTQYESEAIALVEGMESWGGWPSQDEVEMYLEPPA